MSKRRIVIDGEIKLVSNRELLSGAKPSPKKPSKKAKKEPVFDDPDNHDYSETVLVESDPILTEEDTNKDHNNLTEDK